MDAAQNVMMLISGKKKFVPILIKMEMPIVSIKTKGSSQFELTRNKIMKTKKIAATR